MKRLFFVWILFSFLWVPGRAQSGGDHREAGWVATWATPLHFDRGTPFGFEKLAAQMPQPTSPTSKTKVNTDQETQEGLSDHTERMVIRLSRGGKIFRLRLLNEFGGTPVRFDDVHIALQRLGSEIMQDSDRPVTFAGKPTVTVAPGVMMLSDPIPLAAPNLAHLCVSIFLQHLDTPPAIHSYSQYPVSYVSADPGDFAGEKDLPHAKARNEYHWLAGIDVSVEKPVGAIVAMGDSITDAVGAQHADQDWPSKLAERLSAADSENTPGVVNAGISGNRLLQDGAAISGLARLEHDALLQPSAKWLILLEGENDLGFASMLKSNLSAQDLIDGYRQVVAKAHALGLKVIGCTLLPNKGATYYRQDRASIRREVNEAIRSEHIFDAVIDFDAVMHDPNDPESIRPDLQRGDHLHPNASGYEVMSQSIDLNLFK